MERRVNLTLGDGVYGPGDVTTFNVKVRQPLRGPELPNWQTECALASVEEPFDWRGNLVRFVTFSPRNNGETLATVFARGGFVAVGRVFPGVDPTDWYSLDPAQMEYWAVGMVRPLEV